MTYSAIFGTQSDVLIIRAECEIGFMRRRYLIPLVLILLSPIGLIMEAALAQPLSIIIPQSGITDNYEDGGIFGFQIGLFCAIIIVAIRLRNDMKKTDNWMRESRDV